MSGIIKPIICFLNGVFDDFVVLNKSQRDLFLREGVIEENEDGNYRMRPQRRAEP